MNDYSLQFASITDTEEIIALLSRLYHELGEESYVVAYLQKGFIEEILSGSQTEIYLIKKDNMTIGVCTLTESRAIYAGGRLGCLDELFIVPEFRCMGIGTFVINEVRKIGGKRKWKRIDVTGPIDAALIQTLKFYVNRGFVFTGPKYKLPL